MLKNLTKMLSGISQDVCNNACVYYTAYLNKILLHEHSIRVVSFERLVHFNKNRRHHKTHIHACNHIRMHMHTHTSMYTYMYILVHTLTRTYI